MNSLRIALTELRRLTAGRLPKVALLAMTLIPTLYAGLYLYANHDPYDRLDQVPAALVVEDAGATDTSGARVEAGRQVADQLLDRRDFGWREVTRAEAERGVREGRYDFALAIPRDFSVALTSAATSDPEQARLQMITNDANSYLSTTIANSVTDKVRDAVAQQVSEKAAESFLLGLTDVRQGLLTGADGAGQLASGADRAEQGAGRLTDGATTLSSGATTLADGMKTLDQGLAELEEATSGLPDATTKLATGARQVATADATIAGYGDAAATAVTDLQTAWQDNRDDLVTLMQGQGLDQDQQQAILDAYDTLGQPLADVGTRVTEANDQLAQLAAGADAVADGAEELAQAAPDLAGGIAEAHAGSTRLNTGAAQLASGAADLAEGATELQTGLSELHDGASDLQQGLADGAAQVPGMDAETRARVAQTIGNPVDIRSTSQAEASSYGAGLAPFFLALAAWIGGYVLFLLVRPLSPRALAANVTPLRVALGGWIPPLLVGLAQMTVVLAVVAFALDIRPAHLPATLVFLMVTSATFIAIIHALNAWLGTAGQFLGLVLMVVQLVTAGGTFPWQTIPQPLHVLHHLLPMSYAVDGLRQLMYGGMADRVWLDLAALAVWLGAALLVTSRVARHQRVWSVKRVRPELAL
ncbi:YhgE/Pip domain-containing protein [Nocardioides sp. AE5]|uniref:YhgE/Pip domain-containing protein n=1 Tax=Nocardioides sp. AE5 TaxID=2962573 RepID=UPI002881F527|nr:YhgE/Pip domain-containing protein [Nocardioides sp. AE5]MDT0202252.1 YhgE/Pip domain-containing protein [Nocardioides sp. AE5]